MALSVVFTPADGWPIEHDWLSVQVGREEFVIFSCLVTNVRQVCQVMGVIMCCVCLTALFIFVKI
eukprot:4096967-Amphidinium_carterae.2